MYWPGATGFIRQADCWYGLKDPALRTLASLLLSRAFVVFAFVSSVPVFAHAANSPRVRFDTGYLVPCYQVESDDPNEENDVLNRDPARVKKMQAELGEWQKSVIRSLNGCDYR